MKQIGKFISLVVLLLSYTASMAQDAEMADTMRSEGKIYVVVLMICLVLGGMILYLFMLDRKLTRMEKQLRDKKQTKS